MQPRREPWKEKDQGQPGRGEERGASSDTFRIALRYSRIQTAIMPNLVLFTQPGCFSCELMRVYLEAREIAFEERDISTDPEDRRAMTETYDSNETPTLVIDGEPVIGFDPALLDQILDPAPSSDSVPEI